jgi:UDP-N-acetylmuramoyl-tripeptide--D-alanyl-D-alanine ligase
MNITIGSNNFKLSDAARACGGYLVGADRVVSSVCTDSREAGNFSLFIALHGERTDGHAYILKAI